jgi:hypothetical protein
MRSDSRCGRYVLNMIPFQQNANAFETWSDIVLELINQDFQKVTQFRKNF